MPIIEVQPDRVSLLTKAIEFDGAVGVLSRLNYAVGEEKNVNAVGDPPFVDSVGVVGTTRHPFSVIPLRNSVDIGGPSPLEEAPIHGLVESNNEGHKVEALAVYPQTEEAKRTKEPPKSENSGDGLIFPFGSETAPINELNEESQTSSGNVAFDFPTNKIFSRLDQGCIDDSRLITKEPPATFAELGSPFSSSPKETVDPSFRPGREHSNLTRQLRAFLPEGGEGNQLSSSPERIESTSAERGSNDQTSSPRKKRSTSSNTGSAPTGSAHLETIFEDAPEPLDEEAIKAGEKAAWKEVLGVDLEVKPLPKELNSNIKTRLGELGFGLGYIPEIEIGSWDDLKAKGVEEFLKEIEGKYANWKNPNSLSSDERENPAIKRNLNASFWNSVKDGNIDFPSMPGGWIAIEKSPQIVDNYSWDFINSMMQGRKSYLLNKVGLPGYMEVRMPNALELNLILNRYGRDGNISELTSTEYGHEDIVFVGAKSDNRGAEYSARLNKEKNIACAFRTVIVLSDSNIKPVQAEFQEVDAGLFLFSL